MLSEKESDGARRKFLESGAMEKLYRNLFDTVWLRGLDYGGIVHCGFALAQPEKYPLKPLLIVR
jgi:hypothetical protein